MNLGRVDQFGLLNLKLLNVSLTDESERDNCVLLRTFIYSQKELVEKPAPHVDS